MYKHNANERNLGDGGPQAVQSALLVAVREEERKKIARELHDSVGQEMAALALQINSALHRCMKLGVKREIRAVCESLLDSYTRVSDLTARVGRISHELHPSIIEQIGLAAALRAICAETNDLRGVQVHYVGAALPQGLRFDILLCLYRIAQEALHNIIKHSCASSVNVNLCATQGEITLQINDNGCGFEAANSKAHTGLGIRSMQERASCLGGEFLLKTELGKGTEITVRIPTGD